MNVAEELTAIRARVSARLDRTVPEIPEFALPPLGPLRQARAVAEGWAGAMGAVNPRRPGPVNSVLQGLKKLLARSLRWFAFPQTQFNAGTVAALIRAEEMFADLNRNMVVLGQNLVEQQKQNAEFAARIESRMEAIEATVAENALGSQMVFELLRQQIDQLEEHIENERKSARETYAGMSESIAVSVQQIHADVANSVQQIQADVAKVEDRFWSDFKKFRDEIVEELRLARQRLRQAASPAAVAGPGATAALTFDYSHFEQRFRGKEADIRERQSFYLPLLRDQSPVLDIACGRGEMLELLREQGIAASGVDLDPDMVARCQSKDLAVTHADALAHLESLERESLGAVFSAQFVEHLPAAIYVRLIELAYSRLRPGGRLILETQNPECLAIFSQSFYLDPTHQRPVPAEQLRFFMEEAGFGEIEVHYLSPLQDAGLPRLPGDDDATRQFNEKFFGYMDYGIVGYKRKP